MVFGLLIAGAIALLAGLGVWTWGTVTGNEFMAVIGAVVGAGSFFFFGGNFRNVIGDDFYNALVTLIFVWVMFTSAQIVSYFLGETMIGGRVPAEHLPYVFMLAVLFYKYVLMKKTGG